MHIHILGICGTFMGGLAAIAKQSGHRVTGCDADVYPPMSAQLEAQGIELVRGYGAGQLAFAPDLWVIGNVVSRGNPLMEAVLDRGDPYVSGPQWIAEWVLRSKWVLAVAGTHGKTTTASMLAWLLADAGLNPGFLIGGIPENFGVSARANESRFFVIEADEYDTAFFDKRSKFVHYRPRTAILNNLEFDHADIFSDLGAIERQFHHFVRTIPASGLILVNAADAALKRVLTCGCWTPVERFGTSDGWRAAEAGNGGFSVLLRGQELGTVRWPLVGEHNRTNALAAIAAAHHAGVPVAQAIDSLARFRGVRRRLELCGTERGVSVYDDFAHHPTAIRATIAGLRESVGDARILAVLEPRSNTMKRGLMKDELAPSLAGADRVYCYCAGLGWDARAALAPLGGKAECETDLEALVATLAACARPGDHVLVMSNGGFGGIHQRLLAAIAGRS